MHGKHNGELPSKSGSFPGCLRCVRCDPAAAFSATRLNTTSSNMIGGDTQPSNMFAQCDKASLLFLNNSTSDCCGSTQVQLGSRAQECCAQDYRCHPSQGRAQVKSHPDMCLKRRTLMPLKRGQFVSHISPVLRCTHSRISGHGYTTVVLLAMGVET